MEKALLKEVVYKTSRSSGPGGQHVNKTESRVELHWSLEESEAISPEQKELLRSRLGRKLSKEGVLIMSAQRSRSQLKNKDDVTTRFLKLIEFQLIPKKFRHATRPTRSSVQRRLEEKKRHGDQKKDRGKPSMND